MIFFKGAVNYEQNIYCIFRLEFTAQVIYPPISETDIHELQSQEKIV